VGHDTAVRLVAPRYYGGNDVCCSSLFRPQLSIIDGLAFLLSFDGA